ncbi:acyl-CoA N-acyltransferase [Rhizodiscina lignyota]|uniref:Acyl-CoA N-acyltransferase n=1 Tax=Rhizodiscina lignyota TaxID=1504668 RepID=A0A9P4ID38_9PEZI|nr:acyl-CoA N-acyltransferase [Rhizodiscina lignyota]
MPLSLHPALPSDLDTLIEIYFLSFQNPLALTAFPDVPPVRKWWTDSIEAEIKDPTALFLKVVEGDEIIAWAKWNRPVAGKADEPLPQWPEGGDKELAQAFFRKMADMHHTLIGSRPHWYLELLATHPSHQRKGAGGMLLNYVCKLADAKGDIAYLEASPVSVSTYQRYGFKEKDRVKMMINGEEYVNQCMVRDPQRAEECNNIGEFGCMLD